MPIATADSPLAVVDCSAIAALVFGEPDGDKMAARLTGALLAAPALFDLELASVCLKKRRREPEQAERFLESFAASGALGIALHAVDVQGALSLAECHGLSIYDASYLWLARHLSAPLVTLDRRLAEAAARA